MKKIAIFAAVVGASAAALPAQAQDTSLAPNYQTVTLPGGFTPDPRIVSVTAGGDRDAARLGRGCVGSISNAPDVRVNYRAGVDAPLIFHVASEADTTLVINGPDGQWYCNDDGPGLTLNPKVVFQNARAGQYDVWVGHRTNGETAPGRLSISEINR